MLVLNKNTLPVAPGLNENYTNLNRLLENYFNCEFAYREIMEFLKVYHNKNISLSTVKKKFKKLGLSRRSVVTQRTPNVEVEAAMQDEITGSRSNVGYWLLLSLLFSFILLLLKRFKVTSDRNLEIFKLQLFTIL